MANNDINYDINYNDPQFKEVNDAKTAALNDVETTYQGMIDDSEKHYNDLIDNSKKWAKEQAEQQQAQSDFTIKQINQQKAQTQKDYIKEQSGAYTDWQKQSGKYSANAEQLAAAGLANTGYSESAQVAMYNTYQNRVATARESYQKAVQNYDNAITEARLQNSSILAQIAADASREQLELSLQGFQYKNQLVLDKAATKREVENTYYNRYQDVLNQMNIENNLAENVRQFNEEMDYKNLLAEIENAQDVILNPDDNAPENTTPEPIGTPAGERGGSKVDGQPENQTHPTYSFLDSPDLGPVVNAVIKTDAETPATVNAVPEVQPIQETKDAPLDPTPIAKPLKKPLVSNGNGSYTATTIDEVIESRNGNAANSAATNRNTTVDPSKGEVLQTDYYYGYYNPDGAEFGVFNNGYQPKGISGHGKVKKTGDYVTFAAKTLSGETRTVTQNLWKTNDGKFWYWDGSQNKYIQFDK